MFKNRKKLPLKIRMKAYKSEHKSEDGLNTKNVFMFFILVNNFGKMTNFLFRNIFSWENC